MNKKLTDTSRTLLVNLIRIPWVLMAGAFVNLLMINCDVQQKKNLTQLYLNYFEVNITNRKTKKLQLTEHYYQAICE